MAKFIRLAVPLLLLAAIPCPAEVTESAPVPATVSAKSEKPKKLKFKGMVISITRVAITVQGRENHNLIRTFTYNKKLARKIAKLFDSDKVYQPGDPVEITFLERTDRAVELKGKRRKTTSR